MKEQANLDRSPPRAYTRDEAIRILEELRPHVSLAAAFVIVINAGIRPADVFNLRKAQLKRDSQRRRLIVLFARKDWRIHAIPINSETWSFIEPFYASKGSRFLFPGLSGPPHGSRFQTYKQRLKLAVKQAGIDDIVQPWQSARTTCYARYNQHAPGVGAIMLGHCSDTGSLDPSPEMHAAVDTIPSYFDNETEGFHS